jgi:hypothetical protein
LQADASNYGTGVMKGGDKARTDQRRVKLICGARDILVYIHIMTLGYWR